MALRLPHGDRAVVLQHGAQLVSWCSADGVEHLYVSPRAMLDGQSAVRGGVPVCFPQFNQRGPLLKHGFARHLPWRLRAVRDDAVTLGLAHGPVTAAFWPHAFDAQLTVQLTPNAVRASLRAENKGDVPWPFTTALHTYLRMADVRQAELTGLEGASQWDAVLDVHGVSQGAPRFGAEFDRVYQAPGGPLTLSEAGQPGRLAISQSASCPQTVVWNPGATLCGRLADLPADGWQQMLCIEAGCIDEAVVLPPAAVWEGWQQLAWTA